MNTNPHHAAGGPLPGGTAPADVHAVPAAWWAAPARTPRLDALLTESFVFVPAQSEAREVSRAFSARIADLIAGRA